MGNRYLKRDLEDYAVDDASTTSPYPSRDEIVEALLPESATIESHTVGGYQGTMGFVIQLDGYWWLIKESYGSCSHCDGLMASDDTVEYGRKILRNAHCLPTADDARAFLVEKGTSSGAYGWSGISAGMQDLLDEME